MATELSMLTEPLVVTRALAKEQNLSGRMIDFFEIEWYEASKSRMKKKTQGGVEVLVEKSHRGPLEDGGPAIPVRGAGDHAEDKAMRLHRAIPAGSAGSGHDLFRDR
ncbi:hypothetical protein [Pontibacter sp. BAB1700]|uniref:hypothetical protein n=1 Tax=Pontibacter sp. BAB1700 TaxID=1144253 RepID=UPI000687C021|nr:hypothetical protein [Pontibacter sp. BAB1700]